MSVIQISKRCVDTCEALRKSDNVRWNHKVVNQTKSFNSVNNANKYINEIGEMGDISNTDGGKEYIKTLRINVDTYGRSTSEWRNADYKVGGKDGIAMYICCLIYSKVSGEIVITYSFHHLEESLRSNDVYTGSVGDIRLDWLKWKACQDIQNMLPANEAPHIRWT